MGEYIACPATFEDDSGRVWPCGFSSSHIGTHVAHQADGSVAHEWSD